MSALSIPEAIVENMNLKANAKFAFAECFARLKKGEKVSVTLSDVSNAIALSSEDLIGALRQLAGEGYARLDETADRLDDMVADQKMRLTVHIHAEPLMLFPDDEHSRDMRRYQTPRDEPGYDVVKIGRMIYRAAVSSFFEDWSLTIRARNGDATEQSTLVEGMSFRKENDAWSWFDGLMDAYRAIRERGEPLPGSEPDDPHAEVVAHLVEHGWEPEEAREASEATIGEGDPSMRIEAALRWLSVRRPPLALPAPRAEGESDPDAELFANAVRFAVDQGGVTVSSLRANFGLSSYRASEIMVRLQVSGVVGPMEGAKPREVLVTSEETEAIIAGETGA